MGHDRELERVDLYGCGFYISTQTTFTRQTRDTSSIMANLIFFSGSNSSHSINAKLAQQAARVAKEKGANVKVISLADYPLPLYDPDQQEHDGFPKAAYDLKKVLQDADGVFIASPEYNGSFTPVLKNAIDWVSRIREDGEPMLPAFTGKVYAIGAASPGAMGGMRGLVMLRMLLGNIGINVVPSQIALGGANDAFNDDGSLANDMHATFLNNTIDDLIRFAKA